MAGEWNLGGYRLGVELSDQDVLLATKLRVPSVPAGFVSRPRLAQAFGDGLTRGRALVCAPAGFGKTALLADWARNGEQSVAWLGLDAGDSDPARFWRYAVAALDLARPGSQNLRQPTWTKASLESVTKTFPCHGTVALLQQ